MIRFKCNGQPYIDPWHKCTVEDWEPFVSKEGEPKKQTDIDRPVLVDGRVQKLKIKPGQPINTHMFEEAIIE